MASNLAITDFRMAGFLVARGLTLKGTETNLKGDLQFLFDDLDGKAMVLLHQYPGSPEQRYDAACRAMHDFTKMTIKRSVSKTGP